LLHEETTNPSRARPAGGRRKTPAKPGYPRKATGKKPALAANPRLSRLIRKRRVELCKPEVAGSSPARSIRPCKLDFLLSLQTRSRSTCTSTVGADAGETRLSPQIPASLTAGRL